MSQAQVDVQEVCEGGGAKKYLLILTTILATGWGHVLYLTLNHLLSKSEESLWDAVNPSLLIFQSFAALEVIHVLIGLVRSDFLTTALQVASRLSIVWLNLYIVPESRESPGFPLLLIAWCVTEIVRYSYYALGILNKIPYFITWARYSFFFVLYPLGVSGEMLVTWYCLPYASKSAFNLTLPNPFNFSISHVRYLQVCLLFYVFLPYLYMHMVNQRKKVLSSYGSAPKAKSK